MFETPGLLNCYWHHYIYYRLFRTVAKPRPSDHPLLILFVVGGVTSSEVKLIKDSLNLNKSYKHFISQSCRSRLFRTVAKPRPSDHPLLILFVVGGVASSEVKLIKDTVNMYKPETQVRT